MNINPNERHYLSEALTFSDLTRFDEALSSLIDFYLQRYLLGKSVHANGGNICLPKMED